MSQKHLEKEHRAGIQEEGADVETAGEDGSGQTRVETIHQKEYKGLTNQTNVTMADSRVLLKPLSETSVSVP